MNKLSIKKILLLSLIAVSAIACFGVPMALRGFDGFGGDKQQVLDLGLEYKDGWYLINSAEDYYTMQNNIATGVGADVNYKLTTDIELDVGELTGGGVFGGVFEGDNHSIEYDYTNDIVASASVTWATTDLGGAVTSTKLKAYGCKEQSVLSGGTISNTRYTISDYSIEDSNNTYRKSIGGVVGYAENSTIKNIYVEYTGTLSADIGNAPGALGGIVGTAYNCDISMCIVKHASLSLNGENDTIDSIHETRSKNSLVGGVVGWAYGGTQIEQCLVIDYKGFSVNGNSSSIGIYDGEWGEIYGSLNGSSLVGGASDGEEPEDCHARHSFDAFQKYFNIASYNNPTYDTGNIAEELTNIATKIGDVDKAGIDWVMLEVVNGGEIIQKCFVNKQEVVVKNVRSGKGSDKFESSRTIPLLSGMAWGTFIAQMGEVYDGTGYQFDGVSTTTTSATIYNRYTTADPWNGKDKSIFTEKDGKYYMYARYTAISYKIMFYAQIIDEGTGTVTHEYWLDNDFTISGSGVRILQENELTERQKALQQMIFSSGQYGYATTSVWETKLFDWDQTESVENMELYGRVVDPGVEGNVITVRNRLKSGLTVDVYGVTNNNGVLKNELMQTITVALDEYIKLDSLYGGAVSGVGTAAKPDSLDGWTINEDWTGCCATDMSNYERFTDTENYTYSMQVYKWSATTGFRGICNGMGVQAQDKVGYSCGRVSIYPVLDLTVKITWFDPSELLNGYEHGDSLFDMCEGGAGELSWTDSKLGPQGVISNETLNNMGIETNSEWGDYRLPSTFNWSYQENSYTLDKFAVWTNSEVRGLTCANGPLSSMGGTGANEFMLDSATIISIYDGGGAIKTNGVTHIYILPCSIAAGVVINLYTPIIAVNEDKTFSFGYELNETLKGLKGEYYINEPSGDNTEYSFNDSLNRAKAWFKNNLTMTDITTNYYTTSNNAKWCGFGGLKRGIQENIGNFGLEGFNWIQHRLTAITAENFVGLDEDTWDSFGEGKLEKFKTTGIVEIDLYLILFDLQQYKIRFTEANSSKTVGDNSGLSFYDGELLWDITHLADDGIGTIVTGGSSGVANTSISLSGDYVELTTEDISSISIAYTKNSTKYTIINDSPSIDEGTKEIHFTVIKDFIDEQAFGDMVIVVEFVGKDDGGDDGDGGDGDNLDDEYGGGDAPGVEGGEENSGDPDTTKGDGQVVIHYLTKPIEYDSGWSTKSFGLKYEGCVDLYDTINDSVSDSVNSTYETTSEDSAITSAKTEAYKKAKGLLDDSLYGFEEGEATYSSVNTRENTDDEGNVISYDVKCKCTISYSYKEWREYRYTYTFSFSSFTYDYIDYVTGFDYLSGNYSYNYKYNGTTYSATPRPSGSYGKTDSFTINCESTLSDISFSGEVHFEATYSGEQYGDDIVNFHYGNGELTGGYDFGTANSGYKLGSTDTNKVDGDRTYNHDVAKKAISVGGYSHDKLTLPVEGQLMFNETETDEDGKLKYPNYNKLYEFAGWSTTDPGPLGSDGNLALTTDSDFIEANAGSSTYDFWGASNWYAVYLPIVYKITYIYNGADIPHMNGEDVVRNVSVDVAGATMTSDTQYYTVKGQVNGEGEDATIVKLFENFDGKYIHAYGKGWYESYLTAPDGYTFNGWTVDSCEGTANLVLDPVGFVLGIAKGDYADITLIANYTEHKYSITYDLNGGTMNGTSGSRKYGPYWYTQDVTIMSGHLLKNDGQVFVGWSTNDIDTQLDYKTLYARYNDYLNKTTGITEYHQGPLEDKILSSGATVSRLTTENVEWNASVTLHAVYSRIYTLTIQLNKPTSGELQPGTPEYISAGIYDNGVKTSKTQFIINNDYMTANPLYEQSLDEVVAPSATGLNRLHIYGYTITGWIITSKYNSATNQYYVPGQALDPLPYNYASGTTWAKGSAETVLSNTNMQYLQGEINATPIWGKITVGVIYHLNGAEGYKDDFKDIEYISKIQYNFAYTTNISTTNTNNPKTNSSYTLGVMDVIDIPGYTFLYAHPYSKYYGSDSKQNVLNTSIEIAEYGQWSYELDYISNTASDSYSEEYGKWIIHVEGYYAPILYRLELNIDLPYDAGDDFVINNNGFTLTNIGAGHLAKNYEYVITSTVEFNNRVPTKTYVDLDGQYWISEAYTERQHKLYRMQTSIAGKYKYFIYLLQDQIINYNSDNNTTITDVYNPSTGKEKDFKTTKQLPYFEIPYYTMQYYYTVNNTPNVFRYQTSDVVSEHESYADAKLRLKHNPDDSEQFEIAQPNDWKYSYCNTNIGEFESADFNPVLNVYWYRNVLKLNLKNILDEDGAPTDHGYVLIEETEQVTEELQEHSKYNLIIYELGDDGEYSFMIYGFNDISSLLKEGSYRFPDASHSSSHAICDLCEISVITNFAGTRVEGNIIDIFFGNSVTVTAIDQSYDHSLDQFVGYRFNNYAIKYVPFVSKPVTSVSEFEDFIDEFNTHNCEDSIYAYIQFYNVTIDLRDYEYGLEEVSDGVYENQGTNGNTTNYFTDLDTLEIVNHFNMINYKTIYEVTDSSGLANHVFGNIKYEYEPDGLRRGAEFTTTMTRDDDNDISLYMELRLGSEHLQWYLNNGFIQNISDRTKSEVQEYVYRLNAQYLRDNIYTRYSVGGLETYYSAKPTQQLGYMEARCKDIDFGINVYIKDVTTGENAAGNYNLEDMENYTQKMVPLFEIYEVDENGVAKSTPTTTVNLNEAESHKYVIKWKDKLHGMYKYLAKNETSQQQWNLYKSNEELYNSAKKYAYTNMYIKHSLSHSTNQLVTNFDYPIEKIDDIEWVLTSEMLSYIVNYTQFEEVKSDENVDTALGIETIKGNRYLNFYVEVSPLVELAFEESEATGYADIKKGDRSIVVGGTDSVANATHDNALTFSSYLGYIGQNVKISFNANKKYYTHAVVIAPVYDDETKQWLYDDNGYPIMTELKIPVNGSINYVIKDATTLIVKLVPKTYNTSLFVEYNGNTWNYADYDNVATEIKNASDIPLFESIKFSSNNTTGVYYYGDSVKVRYVLNIAGIANYTKQFNVDIYANGVKLTGGAISDSIYEFNRTFNGKDIKIEIKVSAVTQEVVLRTNMVENVGEIVAQINDGSYVVVQTETGATTNNAFDLINGDKLNVYIKPSVGYRFDNGYQYQYSTTTTNVTPLQVTEGEYTGYQRFTLFNSTGFDITQNGVYYLLFNIVEIETQFKYYVSIPNMGEDLGAGQGYMASSEDEIIKPGSEVTITKGTDNPGYRFIGYSYIAPSCNIEKPVGNIIEHKPIDGEKFNINKDIVQYLETINIERATRGEVGQEEQYYRRVFTIYVNYIKQYTFDYEYICDEALVQIDVTNDKGEELTKGVYYDYGTELNISAKSRTSDHHELITVIETATKTLLINTETVEEAGIVEGSKLLTRKGKLSGFEIEQVLDSEYLISLDILLEKYKTTISQALWYETTDGYTPEISTKDIGKGEDTEFRLVNNIYYVVDPSTTFDYGSEAIIKVYVAKAVDPTQQYYELDMSNIKLQDGNGNTQKITISQEDEITYNGKECYSYTIKYAVEGENLENNMNLQLNFKAKYWLSINFGI